MHSMGDLNSAKRKHAELEKNGDGSLFPSTEIKKIKMAEDNAHGMVKGLLETFLNHNTQFKRGELRFGHEGLALWLKDFKEKFAKEVYLAGGSVDLRALLPRLKLDMLGDEAFIFIRPYIHSMLIYIRREKEGICVYVFDSQDWGMRYYPTRLIIEALHQFFLQGTAIYLSATMFQPQDVNRGCTEYSLSCLKYLSEYGNQFFKHINSHPNQVEKLEHPCLQADTLFQLKEGALPESFIIQLQGARNEYEDNLAELNDLLESQYINEEGIDWKKVYEVVAEVQGCFLPLVADELPLYPIEIDIHQGTVTIQFSHKDRFLYDNFLIHSSELYPSSVSLKNSNFLGCQFFNVSYNETANTLIFSLNDINQLPSILKEMDPQAYFKQHMRQQLALQVFKEQVNECLQNELELHFTQKEDRGGFDVRQAQYILRDLFWPTYENIVDIPLCEAISDWNIDINQRKDNRLDLDQLTCPYMIFTLSMNELETKYQLDVQHLVGVWVTKNDVGHTIEIINSLPTEKFLEKGEDLIEKAKAILNARLKSSRPMEFKAVNLPGVVQTNNWPCMIYAIHGLCTLANERLQADFNKESPDKIGLSFLAREYFYAYKRREKIEEKIIACQLKNQQNKKILIEVFSRLQNHPLKNIMDLAKLSLLEEFLCQSPLLSLTQLSINYHNQYPSDLIGYKILVIAALYEGEETLKDITTHIVPHLLISVDPNLINEMNKLCAPQISLHLNEKHSVRQQFSFIKEMLNIYLKANDCSDKKIIDSILGTKLELFDEGNEKYFNMEIQKIHADPALQLLLLTHVISDVSITLISSFESVESRLHKLRDENNCKYQKEIEEKSESIMRKLRAAGASPAMTICVQLAKNKYAWHYVCNYIKGDNYFDSGSEDVTLAFLHELAGLSFYVSLYAAGIFYTEMYPNKAMIDFFKLFYPDLSNRDIKQLVIQVPNSERLAFLGIVSSYITNFPQILRKIPKDERALIVIFLTHLITDGDELLDVIEVLPKKDRLFIVGQFKEFFSGEAGSEYACRVIRKLPDEEILGFANNHVNEHFSSMDAADYYYILSALWSETHFPAKYCSQFVFACKDKVIRYDVLAILLAYSRGHEYRIEFGLEVFQRLLNEQSDKEDYSDPDSFIYPLDTIYYVFENEISTFIEKLKFNHVEQLFSLKNLSNEPVILAHFLLKNIHLITNKEMLHEALQLKDFSEEIRQTINQKWSQTHPDLSSEPVNHATLFPLQLANRPSLISLSSRSTSFVVFGQEILKISDLVGMGYATFSGGLDVEFVLGLERGCLRISPNNFEKLQKFAKENRELIREFQGDILFKGWVVDDYHAPLKILALFRNIKKFSIEHCSGKDLAELIARSVQFYRVLGELNLPACGLSDSDMRYIIESTPMSVRQDLRVLDIKGNHLSPEMIKHLQKIFSSAFITSLGQLDPIKPLTLGFLSERLMVPSTNSSESLFETNPNLESPSQHFHFP